MFERDGGGRSIIGRTERLAYPTFASTRGLSGPLPRKEKVCWSRKYVPDGVTRITLGFIMYMDCSFLPVFYHPKPFRYVLR